MIDESRIYTLTKYASTKGVKNMVKSDHNMMYGQFRIEYKNLVWRKPRKEIFNLKNPECQTKFTDVTNNSLKLKQCFESNLSFPDKCNKFFKSLDDIIHQCFRKVRVGTKSTLSKEIENLLSQKTKLKIFLAGNISNLEEETKTKEK